MGLNRRTAAGSAIAGRPVRATSRPSASSGGWLPIARAVPAITIAALTCSTLSAQAAEVYRWTDERGTVNYSNEPPPKGATAKDVRTVEDRLSIYTPEKLPERPPASAQKPPPSINARETATDRRAPPPPPPPGPLASDPCLNAPNQSECYGVVPYPGSPVFVGPQRPPRLVQPVLPPGTIAGQSTSGGGIIPGQSGNAPPASSSRSSRQDEPSASFTVKGQERERESRDSRR